MLGMVVRLYLMVLEYIDLPLCIGYHRILVRIVFRFVHIFLGQTEWDGHKPPSVPVLLAKQVNFSWHPGFVGSSYAAQIVSSPSKVLHEIAQPWEAELSGQ